ncbi:hypothetical protein [Oxalicibacterium faecigallinarum]|uniref:Uncharacterized protein n=1 Tax=Oxalicibacterium faecigallinarum TaxID=573741 RepID=A0A8J3AYR4_9BURK|nr:hypothetical protein [Oxalicibacterium faecigallinarum]GGI19138.1 hypothetical protein GCM10008066_17580 [Oxalicibacterium faecigallinarum]
MRKVRPLLLASLLVSSVALAQFGNTSKPATPSTEKLEPGHGKREADFVMNKERERLRAEAAEQQAAQNKAKASDKPRTQKTDTKP